MSEQDCEYDCPDCGKKLVDVGGYWGCLCLWGGRTPTPEMIEEFAMNEPNIPRCGIHTCESQGPGDTCNALAVSVWKSPHGDTAVCEQHEALIQDCAKGGTMAAVFEPLPA